jgi:glycosyltransferase involved in cell wall biosynthesis
MKENKFLFVSNDFKKKGGEIVCNAFKRFKRDFPDYSLNIVGDCPVEVAADPEINYLGFIDKTDSDQFEYLGYLYESSMAFLLPSSQDMTPLVIAEALSCGCPVISVDRFGISEMMDVNSGFLCSDRDDYDVELFFESKMRLLANNGELSEELSMKAKLLASDKFSWKRVGEMMKNVIWGSNED